MTTPAISCTAANKLVRDAEALGWTAEVRPGRGELAYQADGEIRGNGTVEKIKVTEPVASVGVYLTRGVHHLAVWYAAREAPERRTKKGALSWTLDGAVGRRLIGDGWTPTAFKQAFETVETTGRDGKAKRTRKAVGPTTLAQVQAYLAEHGEAPEPAPMEYVDALFAVVDAVAAGPNWRSAA